MEKVYVYYESVNIKESNDSNTVPIIVFDSWDKARKFMNQQREKYIKENGAIPHPIDGNGDKTWVRLYISQKDDYYLDLITDEKSIRILD